MSFSLGCEEKISLSLDDLIKQRKKEFKTTSEKTIRQSKSARLAAVGKASSIKRRNKVNSRRGIPLPVGSNQKKSNQATTHSNVVKQIRQKSNQAASKAFQQERRKSLKNTAILKTRMKLLNKKTGQPYARNGKSNSIRTRATDWSPSKKISASLLHSINHPKKFEIPKGGNFKITINTSTVAPVVGINKDVPNYRSGVHNINDHLRSNTFVKAENRISNFLQSENNSNSNRRGNGDRRQGNNSKRGGRGSSRGGRGRREGGRVRR